TTQWVEQQLRDQEFRVIYAGRAQENGPVTLVEGRGKHRGAGQRVATALQVTDEPQWEQDKADPIVTVTVGQDQVARAQADGGTYPRPGQRTAKRGSGDAPPLRA